MIKHISTAVFLCTLIPFYMYLHLSGHLHINIDLLIILYTIISLVSVASLLYLIFSSRYFYFSYRLNLIKNKYEIFAYLFEIKKTMKDDNELNDFFSIKYLNTFVLRSMYELAIDETKIDSFYLKRAILS